MKPVEYDRPHNIVGYDSPDKFTSSESHSPAGSEDGDNSLLGQGYDEQTEIHPLGTGEPSSRSCDDKELDRLLNIAEIERRFLDATRTRLKPTTQRQYLFGFRQFVRISNIGSYSKRQLSGKLGKRLILEYLQHISRASWRYKLAGLRIVWEAGIVLSWPINNKTDIGKMPKTRREPTPPDDIVREWAESLSREKDPYLRLFWLFIAQFGWRPSHASGVRWGDVRYDASGKPYAIIASGANGEFKTYSPIAVRLPPDVVQALEEWKKLHPAPHPENLILSWRSVKGTTLPAKRLSIQFFHKHWNRLRKKYGLPALRPKDLRHWVSTACRKAGLSKVATAYMQGHDATDGGAMRDWYDSPRVEEIFEEQEACLPKGPLAFVRPLEVELQSKIPSEAIALLEGYLAGEVKTMDFMNGIEEIRRKASIRMTT